MKDILAPYSAGLRAGQALLESLGSDPPLECSAKPPVPVATAIDWPQFALYQCSM